LPLGTPLAALIDAITDALALHNIGMIRVELGAPGKPYAVEKLLSADLEDRDANLNWRPGWRSFDAVALL
jgi:hypothetical protein